MARTRERRDEFQTYATTADTIGVAYEWWSPRDIKDRFPLVNVEGLVGSPDHPTHGHINPAGTTMPLPRLSRRLRAQHRGVRRGDIAGCRVIQRGAPALHTDARETERR